MADPDIVFTDEDAAALADALNLVPFPDLPPPPEDPGEYLTHFACASGGAKFDRDGNLQLTLTVVPEDKYKAVPLTDIRGRLFNVTFHAQRGRRPLLENGVLAVYGARERVVSRSADRAWQRVSRIYFEGSEDDDT